MVPVARRALANDQGAGKSREGHSDRRDAYPDAGARRWRRTFQAPQVADGRGNIAPTPASVTRDAFQVDLRRFVNGCGHTAELRGNLVPSSFLSSGAEAPFFHIVQELRLHSSLDSSVRLNVYPCPATALLFRCEHFLAMFA